MLFRATYQVLTRVPTMLLDTATDYYWTKANFKATHSRRKLNLGSYEENVQKFVLKKITHLWLLPLRKPLATGNDLALSQCRNRASS